MSLTSFLSENVDVRDRFRQEFRKPEFLIKKELVAPPLTTRYSTVGTAFDYLLRFFLQRLNTHTIVKDYWVADKAVERLTGRSGLFRKGQKIVSQARKDLEDYLRTGKMSDALIKSALLLATLDPIFRAGEGHEMVGVIYKDDIQDVRNLIAAVDKKYFSSKDLCLVNPNFGAASGLVGGADADLVIDDMIIDIKTTKKLSLDRRTFDQVLGYYVLHHIAGVGGIKPHLRISKVAIYFSRFGHLHVMSLSEFVNSVTFPKFVRWFKQRATQEFSLAAV